MDPFMRSFRLLIDDVGAVLRSLESPPFLADVFENAQKLAHLTLEVPKCKLVPLAGPFTDELKRMYETRIASLVP
eukprot:30430-Pyramimonas_sp.AAC.1